MNQCTRPRTPGANFMRPILLIILFAALFSCNIGVDKNSTDNTTLKESNGHIKTLLNRPTYSVEYLSNWTIDSSSKLFDLDGHFTLHSPFESGLITFFIFNISKDEDESLQDQINAQLAETIKNGNVSYFSKWGNYQGHGAIIKGKMNGAWKSEIKIFVHSTTNKSFLITSIYADGYKDDVLPGLNQIESSFKLK
jgi:hypothetical protein